MRALLAEDQEESAIFLKRALEDNGFTVDWEKRGAKALWQAKTNNYDIFLCDLNLPEKNGIEILESLRKNKNGVPFIVISVTDGLETKLRCFKLGADDYLVKPFVLSELVARSKALLRRGKNFLEEILQINEITLDNNSLRVFKKDKEIQLRRKEYNLLFYLMKNAGKVISRTELLENIWDLNADPFTNTVEVHIQNLRRRLGDKRGSIIRTVYGRGYEFKTKNTN